MLDKTELLQLIETPIGKKCLITDPFPTIGANRIWDDHEHLVVFQNECEFV